MRPRWAGRAASHAGTSSGATTEHPSARATVARVAEHGGLHPHHEVALLRLEVASQPLRVADGALERVLDRAP